MQSEKQKAIIEKKDNYRTKCTTCYKEDTSTYHHLMRCPPAIYVAQSFCKYLSELYQYELTNTNTTRSPSDIERAILFLDIPWVHRLNITDEKGVKIAERNEFKIKQFAHIANIAQTIIRRIWIKEKL